MWYIVLQDYGDMEGTGHPMLLTQDLAKAREITNTEIYRVNPEEFYKEGLWENIVNDKDGS